LERRTLPEFNYKEKTPERKSNAYPRRRQGSIAPVRRFAAVRA
jgi:hypothetical protein